MTDNSEYTDEALSEAIATEVMGECVHKRVNKLKLVDKCRDCGDEAMRRYGQWLTCKPYAEDRNHAFDALEKWMQSNPSHNYQIGDIGRKDGFKYTKLYLGANTLADVDNKSLARAICLALLQAVRA